MLVLINLSDTVYRVYPLLGAWLIGANLVIFFDINFTPYRAIYFGTSWIKIRNRIKKSNPKLIQSGCQPGSDKVLIHTVLAGQ